MTCTAEVMRKCSEQLTVMLLLDRTWMEQQCKGLLTQVKVIPHCKGMDVIEANEDRSLLLSQKFVNARIRESMSVQVYKYCTSL